jgi:hypothetical protein
MDSNKNRPRDRKVFYIAPLFLACALAILVGVIILRSPPAAQDEAAHLPGPVAPQPPKSTTTPSLAPLVRADLILRAQRATAEYAATGKLTSNSDPLIGRRFSLSMPFGCNGANGVMLNPQTTVSYDAAQGSLTVTAQPSVWTSLPVMQPLLDSGEIEAVEGFWVPRPWTMSETCPLPSNAPPPPIITPATAQTLGLAQIFGPGSTRTLRHSEHPYSLTLKLDPTNADLLSHSYHLLLEGTITGYPDGQSLHCWSEAADHQPICIYAVTLERVSFQDAATGKILTSWSD